MDNLKEFKAFLKTIISERKERIIDFSYRKALKMEKQKKNIEKEL